MSKHLEFNTAATKIQAWTRQCATKKLLRIARTRFNLLEQLITKEIQMICPSYQLSNNQDYLNSTPAWPLFTMNPLEYDFVHTVPVPEIVHSLEPESHCTIKDEVEEVPTQPSSSHSFGATDVEGTLTRQADRSILQRRLRELESERIWLEQAITDRIKMLKATR